MTLIRLPDGCSGLDMADGRKYSAGKPGGLVEMSNTDAKYLRRSWYGQSGVMRGGPQFTLGTRRGRWCAPCKRVWQAWSADCPRCGKTTTVLEEC